jgi:hypothetical protein
LVIDDLGKEHSGDSGYFERTLERLIRHRSDEMLPTIITSNMSGTEMSQRYKVSTLEVMRGCYSAWVVGGVDDNGKPLAEQNQRMEEQNRNKERLKI